MNNPYYQAHVKILNRAPQNKGRYFLLLSHITWQIDNLVVHFVVVVCKHYSCACVLTFTTEQMLYSTICMYKLNLCGLCGMCVVVPRMTWHIGHHGMLSHVHYGE